MQSDGSGLNGRDVNFFESRPSGATRDFRIVRDELRPHLLEALEKARSPVLHGDILGALKYLDSDVEHDSEGRDLNFDKRSFSRTELQVAHRQAPANVARYLVYRFRFNHYPRNHELTDFPILLAIEPTSVCNLRCVMCFQADKSFTGDRSSMGYMDLDLYKRVIDEGSQHGLCAVVLASRGEPLLHPKIGEMIAWAKRRGVLDVKLNTNATNLTDERIRSLLDARLDTLVFSIDSYEKEEFERIRPPAKFATVIRNIERFHEIREREYSGYPTRTRVSMVRLGPDQDVEAAYRFWKGRVDEFGHRWVIDRLHIYDLNLVELARPCSLLWERLYVWFDGIVNPCDEDYKSRLRVGTTPARSIRDLWHSPDMQRYRQSHMTGRKNDLHPCDHCNGF